MAGKVVNCCKEKYDVYIGRPGKWANPFVLEGYKETCDKNLIVQTRRQALEKYIEWFYKQPNLLKQAMQELKGKTLGCWCKPDLCHGDFLVQLVNGTDFREENKVVPKGSGV